MSKVDAQRAMREAKYARLRASGPTRREEAAEASGAALAAAPTPKPAVRTAKAPAVVATSSELCGHRSMNGRTCTREAAHPEKNHRYG